VPGTAILYLAHSATEPILGRFLELRSECAGRGYDVFLLFDQSRSPAPAISGACVHPFELGSIVALGFPMTALGGKPAGIVPGHTDYPLIHFFLAHPAYDAYWLVEYDVRYTGSWGHFFDTCGQSGADLLATHVQRFRDNEQWCWWDSLRYQEQPIAGDERVRAFLPTYRLSGPACHLLADEYRKGWAGHFEVRLPTVLALNGCTLEDIGGQGDFVRAGNQDRFYLGENTRPAREATFRWRPVMAQPGPLQDKLWHPVKRQLPPRQGRSILGLRP